MRLGLIGSTGHWHTYAPALEHVAGLTLVAVAPTARRRRRRLETGTQLVLDSSCVLFLLPKDDQPDD